MYDNDIERVLTVAGTLDHVLKLGPLVVGGRRAGLDVFGDDAPPARGYPSLRLLLLIGDRQILLGLSAGRNAQVDCSPWRGGRFRAASEGADPRQICLLLMSQCSFARVLLVRQR